MSSQMNTCVRGLCKDQDYLVTGKIHDIEYGICFDGHGSNEFINKIRDISQSEWDEIIMTENPWNYFRDNYLSRFRTRTSSGSTFSMFKIQDNKIDTCTIGDSTLVIFRNGELVYTSTPHKLENNSSERIRLAKPDSNYVGKTNDSFPHIRSSTDVYMKESPYYIFSSGTKLAVTQAIGHNGITQYDPEFHTLSFEPEDEIKLVVGSDGMWDMIVQESTPPPEWPPLTETEIQDVENDKQDLLKMNAEELLEKSYQRWSKPEWILHGNSRSFARVSRTNFDGYDDISVITWEYNKKDKKEEKVEEKRDTEKVEEKESDEKVEEKVEEEKMEEKESEERSAEKI
jgi:hypothetical protein